MNKTAKPINWEQVQSVITQMIAKKVPTADILLLAVGTYTGFRVSDWVGLTWGDFYEYSPDGGPVIQKKRLTIREKKGRNVEGKKARSVKIAPALAEILNTCYQVRKPFLNVQLFRGTRGKHGKFIHPDTARRRLRAICLRWGLPPDSTTHSLRKTLTAKMFNDHGKSYEGILYCKQMLGHKSVDTTIRYLGIEDSVVDNFFDSLS